MSAGRVGLSPRDAALRGVLWAGGGGFVAFGGWLVLALVLGGEDPVRLGLWWLGGPLLVDLVVIPVVVVTGVLLRRFVPTRWYKTASRGLSLTALVTLVAVPFVSGLGRRAGNPSLLDRDYVVGYAVLVAVVWVGCLGVPLVARLLAARPQVAGRSTMR